MGIMQGLLQGSIPSFATVKAPAGDEKAVELVGLSSVYLGLMQSL